MRLTTITVLIAAAMLAGCGPQPGEYGPISDDYYNTEIGPQAAQEYPDVTPIGVVGPPPAGVAPAGNVSVADDLGITPADERRRQLAALRGEQPRPTPVDVPAPVIYDRPGTVQYTVVRGDTLWGIAKKRLGAGRRMAEIKALNPGLANPDKIMPGQVLVIPAN